MTYNKNEEICPGDLKDVCPGDNQTDSSDFLRLYFRSMHHPEKKCRIPLRLTLVNLHL